VPHPFAFFANGWGTYIYCSLLFFIVLCYQFPNPYHPICLIRS